MLRSLSLYWILAVTDLTLNALGQHCPLLACINISGCKAITDAGVRTLAAGCPQLIHVDLTRYPPGAGSNLCCSFAMAMLACLQAYRYICLPSLITPGVWYQLCRFTTRCLWPHAVDERSRTSSEVVLASLRVGKHTRPPSCFLPHHATIVQGWSHVQG